MGLQVEQLLEPDLFGRPTAVLSIAVAGSNINLENSKASLLVDARRHENVASQLLAAVASVSVTAATLLKQVHLDYTSLQGCGSACLEESLKKALVATGATYAPGAGALKGVVSFDGVDLPISSTAGQLWATELATLYQTAQDVAQDHVRSTQQGSARTARVLLECSLVSLQAVGQAVGEDSSQYRAATNITMKLVQNVQQLLLDAYDNKMVTQVALLGKVPEPFDSVTGLVQWQEAHRRKLLQSLPASNSLTNAQWSERATAVTSFLVLLAGAFGGVQCLTHMNFKRDTLLFGSAKSD
ncbi:hypothetical protein ABBQ38_005316 [Trebouxia sp. C0009 RCD-2024]